MAAVFLKRNNLRNVCMKLLCQTQTTILKRSLPAITKRRLISVKVPPEEIKNSLSEQNKQNVIERLNTMEKSHILTRSCTEEAAVLVPLCMVKNKPSLLFTLRAPNLVSHKGHVSFPGGKRDKEDKSLVDTAVRETVEELGIPENIIDVWGSMTAIPDRAGKVAVTPVISFLGDIDVEKIPFNHDEVSVVFHMTFEQILQCRRYTRFNNGLTMPVFVRRPYQVWGMTACMTDGIFEMLFPEHYKKIWGFSSEFSLPWRPDVTRKQ